MWTIIFFTSWQCSSFVMGNDDYLSDERQPKCEKSPLSHLKMKCSFLDYVQLLMISRAIWAMKVQLKCDKRPPKSSKNEMLIFGLHSTSDGWPCNPSNKSGLKCRERPPKSWKMKYSFLYYVQLLMIGQGSEWWKLIKMWKNEMLFQLGSSVVSVWVFCMFQSGSSPPQMAR